MFYPLKDRKQR